MHTSTAGIRILLAIVLFTILGVSGPPARAADAYDAAVHHSGRPEADVKRDSADHPADVLRLAGIKPGMRVVDFIAADGYYSELLSYLVGRAGTSCCSTVPKPKNGARARSPASPTAGCRMSSIAWPTSMRWDCPQGPSMPCS